MSLSDKIKKKENDAMILLVLFAYLISVRKHIAIKIL